MPRSFCSFSCGSTDFRSISSVMPSSVAGRPPRRVGEAGELPVAKLLQGGGSVV